MFEGKKVEVFVRSSPACTFCEKLKALLQENKVPYTSKDTVEEEVFMEFCKHRLKTVPAVFVDGEFIGGYSEVSELF